MTEKYSTPETNLRPYTGKRRRIESQFFGRPMQIDVTGTEPVLVNWDTSNADPAEITITTAAGSVISIRSRT